MENKKNEIKRQPCQVFTRVMGYLRPVSHYNIGKKSEFYDRKYFQEGYMCKRDFDRIQSNRDFTLKFATCETEKTSPSIIKYDSVIDLSLMFENQKTK